MISECPRWPRPDPALCARDAVFVLLTAWERSTYPARLQWWRHCYQGGVDVVGFRKALQGVE